jgi:uncharacterized protein
MLLAVSCGEKSAPPDSLNTRTVTLPNGKAMRCEVMIHPGDIMRGMMFRDSQAPDRGMLFIHDKTGKYPYWMYQVRIPLDIIWMDKGRKIVEIAPDTPPCKSASSRECPQYGGNIPAQYVLELAGGAARKEGLKAGDVLQF